MSNYQKAKREAFCEVAETCPAVDNALNIASEAIKEQTDLLRSALVDAIQRALDAEDQVEELEAEVQRLEYRLEQLEDLLK